MMKALVLLLSLGSVCWCKPTTVVNFSPVGNSPGIAPGFAYAFRAPAPLFSQASVYTGAHPILQEHVSNGISAPHAESPTILKTQYHSQDLLGQYAFGYVGDESTAHEVRTYDGAVRGSYTYLDSNGELQTANYIADDKGFRVEATNLPVAPTAPVVPKMLLPEPVKPTLEVQAATAAHLKAVAEIRAARRTRSVPSKGYLLPPPTPLKKEYTYSPISAKVKPVPFKITPVPIKVELVSVKEIHTSPAPLKVYHVPVPSPILIDHHPAPLRVLPGPFPFHTAAASQAVFVKTIPTEPQSLVSSPISVVHPAPIPVAHPAPLLAIVAVPAPAAPSQVLSQFHSQNEFGGFEYGYEGGPSSKHEVHTPDGITRGSYSYVDANGELQTVSYIADDVLGFRVLATNLPVAPADQWASKKEAV